MPNEADREAWNHLRVDLYRLLLPRIQEEDQKAGAYGFTSHWNDPAAKWNDGNVQHAWNAIGLDPIVQELFYVIESMEAEDLAVLESLDALTDPLRCPEQYLPDLAASFGYRLAEGLDEAHKRIVVQGIIQAYKARGRFVGFKMFYRMLGFEVIRIFPLWKKGVNEDASRYARERYVLAPVSGVNIGPAGTQVFTGRLADAPIKPGTLRFFSGSIVVGDDGQGNLASASGPAGTIIYSTGDYTLDLGVPAPGPVTASMQKVTDEFPFHAARIDIEIALSPFGLSTPPPVDEAFTESILGRLDETRPVHVLLRSLAFVVEFADEFSPGASDRIGCTQVLKDVRDGLGAGNGTNRTYVLDQGSTAEDDLTVEFEDAGQPVNLRPFDERAPLVCPLDRLGIKLGNNPEEWF